MNRRGREVVSKEWKHRVGGRNVEKNRGRKNEVKTQEGKQEGKTECRRKEGMNT